MLALVSPGAAGPLPSGTFTPVLVLELATGPEALAAVLGAPADPTTPARVAGWMWAHRLDFGFMVLYSALVAVSALRERAGRWVVALAALTWAADAVETLVLLDLTARWGLAEAPAGRFLVLRLATWTKWLALAAALAALGRRVGGGSGVVLAAALPVTVAAAIHPPWLAEGMGLAVVLGFAVLMVRSVRPIRSE